MTFVSENPLIRSVWRKLEEPLAEILTHLIVTFCSMLSIELIEFIAHFFDWDKKPIPWTSTSLSDPTVLFGGFGRRGNYPNRNH
jgi:hypothetical protein